jgi:3-deoxy-7-phosphoheptulonate synthase
MVIVMERSATEEQVQGVIETLVDVGYDVHRSTGLSHTVLGAVGQPSRPVDPSALELIPGVREVVRISEPYKLVGRTFKAEDSVVTVGKTAVGGSELVVAAGPCSVESREQIRGVASAVAASGARILRGGALESHASPYSFRGHGEPALGWMREAGDESGMAVISEVSDPREIGMTSRYADVLLVGARNMQSFDLLRELGKLEKPVVLERGPAATVDEWLMSAEHLLAGGNSRVILCERGIRTFEGATRCTLDLSAIPSVKRRSHLPILVDPSQGAGRRDKVAALARAAVAAGADGLLIEVHQDPERALSDGARSLDPAQFGRLMSDLRVIAPVLDRSLPGAGSGR